MLQACLRAARVACIAQHWKQEAVGGARIRPHRHQQPLQRKQHLRQGFDVVKERNESY